MSSVDDCRLIDLEKIEDLTGSLSPLYGQVDVPFAIKRVYYLYDVPGGADRGGHAHRALQQLIVAASGSFNLVLDDGRNKRTVTLNRSYYGLYVPPMIWRDMTEFCTGAIYLAFVSMPYEESDYIRDYQEFLSSVHTPASGGGTD
jgi:hypothetical protein